MDFEEFQRWWKQSATLKGGLLSGLLGGLATAGGFLSKLRSKKEEQAAADAKLDPYKRKALAFYHAKDPAEHGVANGPESICFLSPILCVRALPEQLCLPTLRENIPLDAARYLGAVTRSTQKFRQRILDEKKRVASELYWAEVRRRVKGYLLCSCCKRQDTEINQNAQTKKLRWIEVALWMCRWLAVVVLFSLFMASILIPYFVYANAYEACQNPPALKEDTNDWPSISYSAPPSPQTAPLHFQ